MRMRISQIVRLRVNTARHAAARTVLPAALYRARKARFKPAIAYNIALAIYGRAGEQVVRRVLLNISKHYRWRKRSARH